MTCRTKSTGLVTSTLQGKESHATIKLKGAEKTSSIPTIMQTGVMMSSQDLQPAFSAGAIDFIRKPVNQIELTSRVRSMLMLADYFNSKNIAEVKVNNLTKEIQELEIKRLKAELDFKNKELVAKALFLVQKNEIIIKTIAKLHKITKFDTNEISNKISELIQELHFNQ